MTTTRKSTQTLCRAKILANLASGVKTLQCAAMLQICDAAGISCWHLNDNDKVNEV